MKNTGRLALRSVGQEEPSLELEAEEDLETEVPSSNAVAVVASRPATRGFRPSTCGLLVLRCGSASLADVGYHMYFRGV